MLGLCMRERMYGALQVKQDVSAFTGKTGCISLYKLDRLYQLLQVRQDPFGFFRSERMHLTLQVKHVCITDLMYTMIFNSKLMYVIKIV